MSDETVRTIKNRYREDKRDAIQAAMRQADFAAPFVYAEPKDGGVVVSFGYIDSDDPDPDRTKAEVEDRVEELAEMFDSRVIVVEDRPKAGGVDFILEV